MTMTGGLLQGLRDPLDSILSALTVTEPLTLKDLGDFPRSARAINGVLMGKKRWWAASATLRSELEDDVPFDPIGRWYHCGKEYAKSSAEDLTEQDRTMKPGEAVFFRLGAVSAVARKGLKEQEKLRIALGADFANVRDYIGGSNGP